VLLYRAGLTEGALLAWAGTRRLSALALHQKALAAKPVTPASAALALFVAGVDISLAQAERLFGESFLRDVAGNHATPEHFPELANDTHAGATRAAADARTMRDAASIRSLGLTGPWLVDITGDRVRASVSILPLERAWVVCDRLDAPDNPDRLPWPDDSSYHLASAIPVQRHSRWIDLATGNGFVPLARREVATRVIGVDLNPRAISYAFLSQNISDVSLAASELRQGDIASPLAATASLVTCNAPIIGDPDQAIWRRADRDFFIRMRSTARRHVEPGGDIIVHSTLDAMPVEKGAVTDELPGEVAIVVYTPPGIRAYGVMWWSPDKAQRRAVGYRELTAARPHLDPRDRTDVLAGTLPPLNAGQV
jgi:hypothetical protein